MTNEQKYKTTEERFNAFYKKCGSCRVTICDRIKVINCFNNWLTLEAEEEKPKPCPFCGGKHLFVNIKGMKKYELTDETKTIADGTVLHRIRAVRDFTLSDGTKVLAGDLGGWIEKEGNLSRVGSAWVYGDACVYGDALVYGDAFVYGSARVYGDARVCGSSYVCGDARVCGSARVYGDAFAYGSARVCGDAFVYGSARVCGDAFVHGSARVYGDARVCGSSYVCGDAEVKSARDYAVFKNGWSSGMWFTYTKSNRKWKVGCFHGTGEELIAKAYKDSELSGKCYEAIVSAQEAIDKAIAEAEKEQAK